MSGRGDGISLKARGKKPLSSLNRTLRDQFSDAPRAFLIRRLSDLIIEKAPSASDKLVAALAEHLATNPAKPFDWDGSDDISIDIKLTGDDLMPAFEAALKFASEELPEIIPKALASAAEVIVRSLRADWPAQRKHDQMIMAGFSANLHDRWGDAFATLRMMYTISVEIGGGIAAARRRSRARRKPVLNDTMLHLHARACQVVFEIITLMENGLADGAMARWRTLHEITVVATILAEHGEELAIRYRSHAAIESKRAMDRFVLSYEQLGYAPPTKRDITETDRKYQACLDRFGDNFGSEYGWAAQHLGLKKPRLVDLEVAAGKSAMQSYYRMASYNVHAGARGIDFRLGLLDGSNTPTALAGASNAGFLDPARNTAYDLVLITTLLSSGTTRFDRMLEWQILTQLRDELLQQLDKAQRALERAHRAQLRAERATR
ncbi:MAG: hypothetical protein IH987_07265 [Planctomycetes bacterium]|nr:hypothetical protein [Planctomycetota bacterium]